MKTREEIKLQAKSILKASYGVKSDDGKRLIKRNGELFEEFKETEAYNILYMELLGNEGKNAAEFIQKIIPDVDNNSNISVVK